MCARKLARSQLAESHSQSVRYCRTACNCFKKKRNVSGPSNLISLSPVLYNNVETWHARSDDIRSAMGLDIIHLTKFIIYFGERVLSRYWFIGGIYQFPF